MNGDLFTYTYPPTGDIITFCRTADGSIFSKVDNAFAHANGFADLYEMQERIYKDGGEQLPEWLLWHSEFMTRLNLN